MQYLFAQRNTSPELQEQLYRYIHAPLQLDQPSLLDRVNRWIDNKFSVPGTPKVRRPVQQPEPVKELFPLLQPAFELPEQPLPEEVQVQQVHEQLPDPLLQARDEDQPYWSLVDEDVTVLIDPLVGKRVDVFWSSEATWFSGLVPGDEQCQARLPPYPLRLGSGTDLLLVERAAPTALGRR